MPPFTWAIAADLLFKYGPNAVSLAIKIADNIKAGRANEAVSEADKAELTRLASLSSDAIYLRLGITPPPAS